MCLRAVGYIKLDGLPCFLQNVVLLTDGALYMALIGIILIP